MKPYRIAVIAGDGIGTEVVPEGLRVLEAVGSRFDISFSFDELDWGCDRFQQTGRFLPEDGMESIKGHDAIFLGCIGLSLPLLWPTHPPPVAWLYQFSTGVLHAALVFAHRVEC